MSLLRDSAIVGAATFLVGSVLKEISIKQDGEPVGWWPYVGTFMSGALGFYLLAATNVVKVKNAEGRTPIENLMIQQGMIDGDTWDMPKEMFPKRNIQEGERGSSTYLSAKVVRNRNLYSFFVRGKQQWGIKNVYFKDFSYEIGPYPYTAKGWKNGYMKWAQIPMRGRDWATEVQANLGDFTDGYQPTAWSGAVKNAESDNFIWCAYCDDLITDEYYFTDEGPAHVDCNLEDSWEAESFSADSKRPRDNFWWLYRLESFGGDVVFADDWEWYSTGDEQGWRNKNKAMAGLKRASKKYPQHFFLLDKITPHYIDDNKENAWEDYEGEQFMNLVAFAIGGEVFTWDKAHNRKRIGGKYGPIWNNKTKSFSAEGPTDDELESWSERQDDGSMKVTIDEDGESHTELTYKDGDLTDLKRFMAEVFEADRKARRRTTLTWARGMEQGFIGDDDFLKQPRPYENYDYYGSNYKNSNAYHISGLPTGYHIHLWKPRRRSGYWRVFMKSPNSKVWTQDASNSKSRIMPEVLKWYNDAIAAPTETELTPIQQLMIGQGMISGETQIHRIEIPATIQKKKNKITGEMVSKTIIAGKIQYYYSGGENDSEPSLFATYDGEIEFEINSPPASIANFCRGLIYLDTETAGNLRSVNRYNKDRKQWVASHPAWFQNMCKQGINSVYFSARRGTYSIEDNEFLRFYGTHSLPETKTLDLGNGIEKPMFQVRIPNFKSQKDEGLGIVFSHEWITPRPSTQKKMYKIKGKSGAEKLGYENEIGIFNKCVAKYQPQEWDFIKEEMLGGTLLENTEGFNLVGSEPAGHIMCRRFKKK